MKKILLLTGIFVMFLAMSVSAQDNMTKEEKKQAKKDKKEAKKKEQEAKLVQYVELANKRDWAIQAQMVYDEKNNMFNLNPALNFVSVSEDELSLQLSFTGLNGWSGPRGIVMEGTISEYEVTQGKTVKILLVAKGAKLGTVKFTINIDAAGMARAYMSSVQTARLSFQGPIVPLAEAGIFKDKTNY